MEATVTIICGGLLALLQCYTNYRLKEQDNARNAAREEMAKTAASVKSEALAAAESVEKKVVAAAALTSDQLGEIQIKVDGRMSEALAEIRKLNEEIMALKGTKK